jgi:hypothetical protein
LFQHYTEQRNFEGDGLADSFSSTSSSVPASSQKQAGSSTSELQPQISISSIKRKAPDLETLLGKKRKIANINGADELQQYLSDGYCKF